MGTGWQRPTLTSLDVSKQERQITKEMLRRKTADCKRGRSATRLQRGEIAEAQVTLEGLTPSLDYKSVVGMWRLIYTDSIDVLPLLFVDGKAADTTLSLPLRVGDIFQRFSSVEDGRIQNIIRWNIPYILEDEGITLTVNARYSVCSPQRLQLVFESAEIGNLRISEELEALLAPALLPRSSINHQILLALREFSAKFPIPWRGIAPRSDGGSYLLTYLDDDMLIGRALNTGGTFVFDRYESVSP